jgi:hypothetical protein
MRPKEFEPPSTRLLPYGTALPGAPPFTYPRVQALGYFAISSPTHFFRRWDAPGLVGDTGLPDLLRIQEMTVPVQKETASAGGLAEAVIGGLCRGAQHR